MKATLEAYLSALRTAGACVMEHVAQAATNADFAALASLEDCTLPDEVLDMWSVFNGMKATEGVPLGALWLDGTFIYYSVAEAIADYQVSEELWASDPEFEDYLPKGFLPIATPGDGSRLLVNCRTGSPTYGGVYELFHGIGLSKHATSLSAYFETIAAQFKQGVIFLDDEHCLELDFDSADDLAKKMNPGCDAHNDELPSAYETKDWIAPGGEGKTR